MTGTGFVAYGQPSCLFDGSVVVPGEYLSETSIRCIAPAHSTVETVSLAISLNALHYTETGQSFTYVYEPIISWIEPSFGPSQATSLSSIVVHGSNFADAPNLSCRIGAQVTRATYLNADEVMCEMPAQSSFTGVQPLVSVSLNGMDFSLRSDVAYTYVPPSRLQVCTLRDYHDDTIACGPLSPCPTYLPTHHRGFYLQLDPSMEVPSSPSWVKASWTALR